MMSRTLARGALSTRIQTGATIRIPTERKRIQCRHSKEGDAYCAGICLAFAPVVNQPVSIGDNVCWATAPPTDPS